MELVGRQADIAKLRSVLEGRCRSEDNLIILSIDGPGGVGKSSLIRMAESASDLPSPKTLRIRLDGSKAVDSLDAFLSNFVHALKHEASREFARGNIALPETESLLKISSELMKSAERELQEARNAEEIVKVARSLMAIGKAINSVQKKTTSYFDAEKIEKIFEKSDPEDLIVAFQYEAPGWIAKLGIGTKEINLRNELRKCAPKAFASALIKDLSVLINGWKLSDAHKPLPQKLGDCERLILILDDYESMSPYIGSFLAEYFLPGLREARIKTTAVIAGRDDLSATNAAWSQHLQEYLIDPPISVGPLSNQDIEVIASNEGVNAEDLWRDTEGYPFFIQLWIESKRRGGETALSLKKFYDRTTRWMTEEQKNWLEYCLFIDDVNKETLSKITSDTGLATKILEWFMSEGSIRATDTKSFTIRSYLRKRLLEYLEITDPERFRTLSRIREEAAS